MFHLVGDLERRVSTRDQIKTDHPDSSNTSMQPPPAAAVYPTAEAQNQSQSQSHGRMPTNEIASHRGQQGTIPYPRLPSDLPFEAN
jgi:hypothetical protein